MIAKFGLATSAAVGGRSFLGEAGLHLLLVATSTKSRALSHLLPYREGEVLCKMNNTDDATRRLNRFLRPPIVSLLKSVSQNFQQLLSLQ